MQLLKVKQIRQDGAVKIWKLETESQMMTFGVSRKAKLLSIDTEVSPYELVFEYKNNQWLMTNFDQKISPATQVIQDGAKVALPQSILQFQLSERNPFVFQKLSHLKSNSTERTRFVMVTHGQQILRTQTIEENQTFTYEWGLEKCTFDFQKQNEYVWNGLLIKCCDSEKLNSADLMTKPLTFDINSPSFRVSSGLFGFTILLILISLFVPPAKVEVAPVKMLVTNSTIIKTNFKKSKKIIAQNTTSPAASSPAHNTSAQKVKVAIGARISQLLGKVSATEARSKNIVLATAGIKAGEGPSGRALAAIGKVDSSGRDWNQDSVVGQNVGVGTAGRGGGRGAAGVGGSLAQGSTGQGGVGLVEDESEIVGGLDREVIAQYIKTQLGQILYCYERQLSASPDLYGKIAVKFTIAGTGTVETQAINDTTLKNRQVENCILNKIAKWKFPEPRGGTKVLVTYPFLFKSTN